MLARCLIVHIFLSGTKVEGILRQAADVEEVDRRVQEYEHGIIPFKLAFSLMLLMNWRTLVLFGRFQLNLIYISFVLKCLHIF